MGQVDQAEQFYQQTLMLYEKVQQFLSSDIVIILNLLGQFSHSLGKYDQAARYYQQALDVCMKTSGLEKLDTADTFYNLGMVQMNLTLLCS
jgi:tetratricopeptide (TPR) repeat protein